MSTHFGVSHMIAGHNVHLPATQTKKLTWFLSLEECTHPDGTYQYVGPTDSMRHRWENTKSKIISLANGSWLKLEQVFRNILKKNSPNTQNCP